MSKRGLPTGIKMRHDAHYVDEIAKNSRSIGKTIAIDRIIPNPNQPRNEIGDLEELTSSIKEQGVLEPLLVQPKGDKWMIIAGERRWRASSAAGLTEVPCIELDIDDNTVAEIALVENLQRKDLNIWEIADGLADLVNRFDYTHDEIARKIGKSRTTVTESLAIAGLPESVRLRCREEKIEAKSTLIEISREFDEKAMHVLLDSVSSDEGAIVREKVRKKKVSHERKTKTKSDNGPEDHKNIFSYHSEENGFEVTIKHDRNKLVTNTDLLRALKEAFDSVKSARSV